MSLKISQIKDFFSSFSKLEVGGNFYTVAAMSLIFFQFFFPFFVLFLYLGSSNIRTKTLTCIYIHCILQRYNKSVCDRISQKPHPFPLSHVQFFD